MFLSIGAMGNFLGNFFICVSNAHPSRYKRTRKLSHARACVDACAYFCEGSAALLGTGYARGSVGGFNEGSKKGRYPCPDVAGIQHELEEQAKLLELLLGVAHTLPKRPIANAKRPARGADRRLAISELRPHEPRPLFPLEVLFYWGVSFGTTQRGWYIHGGPLFGGGPLLGGSVIGGSTVN